MAATWRGGDGCRPKAEPAVARGPGAVSRAASGQGPGDAGPTREELLAALAEARAEQAATAEHSRGHQQCRRRSRGNAHPVDPRGHPTVRRGTGRGLDPARDSTSSWGRMSATPGSGWSMRVRIPSCPTRTLPRSRDGWRSRPRCRTSRIFRTIRVSAPTAPIASATIAAVCPPPSCGAGRSSA